MNLDVESLQPTWRLWGEEKIDGAIYTVYLKKVRYHRPTKTASSESDDEISHLEWETVRVRFVKAGTVERLVDALATDDGELESTYVNVFLATYRSFATANLVLDLLLRRYEVLSIATNHSAMDIGIEQDHLVDQHKKTLVSALHVWLDTYPDDFKRSHNHEVLHQLIEFTARNLPGSELHSKALHKLTKWMQMQDVTLQDGWGLSTELSATLCLAPGMRISTHHINVYRFPDVPPKHFAEQLTRMDMELFKRLVPHQCLGAVWSKRDKNRTHEAATVLATVNQFNAVSFRVISTILVEPRLKPQERSDILNAWIDVAQELRILKNFSSLKAIISGLQSNPIYRLQKTWLAVPKEKIELFDELARIFSEDNNQWAQRELLMREGTAKFADTVGENDKHLQKIFQKQNTHNSSISHGTIPYLGTFLTDLTMIDTAIPDTIADGLINFDKRRKEFEVLAQIKLLQGAANAYHLPADPIFDRWFDSILVLDDREAYQLSCQIEPLSVQQNKDKKHKKSTGNPHCHRKNDSIASTSSSNSSQFYCDLDNCTISSKNNSLDRHFLPSQLSSSSSCSSIPSLDISLSSGNSGHSKTLQVATPSKHVSSQPTLMSPLNMAQKNSPDFYIIRVTFESNSPETDGVVLYKSIMLSNNERTPQVIRNAMLKLNLEGNPDTFTLSQVLPDREMLLPSNANVYYAVNTAFNLNFILRLKKDNNTQDATTLNGKLSRTKK